MNINENSTVVRKADLVSSELDGELVMLDMDQGQYFGMDTVGSDIWKLIENPISVSALCGELVRMYDVEPEQCMKDTLRFLNDLLDRNILERIS